MIYCVVPEELAPELYDKLSEYYRDDPNVKVIVDRRRSERRGADPDGEAAEKRQQRDRRRARVAGDFARIDPVDAE